MMLSFLENKFIYFFLWNTLVFLNCAWLFYIQNLFIQNNSLIKIKYLFLDDSTVMPIIKQKHRKSNSC